MLDPKSLNDDFPVPFTVFAARLVDTPEEVWIQLLRNTMGTKKLTERGWGRALAQVKAG